MSYPAFLVQTTTPPEEGKRGFDWVEFDREWNQPGRPAKTDDDTEYTI